MNYGRNTDPPYLTFEALSQLPHVRHAFTLRMPRIPVPAHDDPVSSSGMIQYHKRVLQALGTTRASLATANQVHGNHVAVVSTKPRLPVPDTDGLLTRVSGLPIGVYVADCCAVYLVDRTTPAIGLLHSGKKGTLANIAGEAIVSMQRAFQTNPAHLLAVLSPCIGPCHYEMDIPSTIEQQLRNAGVRDIVNPRICTACHLDEFYSHRAEKGNTGRMLAVLELQG